MARVDEHEADADIEAGDQQRRIKSIEVGFRIVRVLEAADGELAIVRIAALTGMPPSKVHIYLSSFVREGLVRQDPATGRYGLGTFAVQLGLAAIKKLDVVSVGRETVDRLREETGCAAILTVWGNRGPTIVLKADGEEQGAMSIRLGHVFRPSTSATGQVFLAYLPEHESAAAVRAERPSPSPPRGKIQADLSELRARIRAHGYALGEMPTASGLIALAAPVFEYSGRIAATLTLVGGPMVLLGAGQTHMVEVLCGHAAAVSRKLGFQPVAELELAPIGS